MPSTKNFFKIIQNSSFSVASPEHTNQNSLGRHVVDKPYNRRNINGQRHSNLLQQLGFILNLKKSVLTPTQRIEFLGVTVDSLIMTLPLPDKKKFRSSV